MITAITVENFKGVKRQEFVFNRVSAVEDGAGGDAFLVFDALWLLDRLARGMVAASAPYGWIGELNPTSLKVTVSNVQIGEVSYEIVLLRFGLISVILSEEVRFNDTAYLVRDRQSYALSNQAQRFAIDNAQAALSVAMPFSGMDPITAIRDELTQVWLAVPDPVQMDSAVKYGLLDRDVMSRHLASYIVSQQQVYPMIYGVMMVTLKELGSSITGLSVEINSLNMHYLAVRYANRYGGGIVPFELVEQNEKILVFAAFVRAVNEYVNPITVVWHSPLNWLGQKEGENVVKMLAKSFSMQGQLIVLSRKHAVLRGVK